MSAKPCRLRKRVRSYFTGRPDRVKTALLVSRIRDLEVIVTASELEALLLENNLIKKHRPPFNVELKDDKHYPYIRLDKETAFPRFRNCAPAPGRWCPLFRAFSGGHGPQVNPGGPE